MAIPRIQQNSVVNAGPSGSITLSFSSTPTNGNMLVLGTWVSNVAGLISSITQTGVTWTKAVQFSNGGGDAEIWYAQNISGAGTSVTVTFSAPAADANIAIAEYSGLALANVLDKTASNGGTGTTADSGTTALTSSTSELCIAMLGSGLTGGAPTLSPPSNGFTQVSQTNNVNTAGAFEEFISTTQILANTGASISNGIGNWAGVIATFSAPPVCPVFMTANDLMTELRERFAEINFVAWISDLDLIRWINLGLDDIVMRTLPPRHEAAPVIIPTTPGVYTYNIPSDWFRNKQFGDSGGFYVLNPTNFGALLEEDRTDDLEEDLATQALPSTPSHFWIWNKKFYIYPIPDIAYNLKLYYYRLPIYVCVTTDAIDLDRPWIETLVKFVLWKALEKDKHPMGQYYRQEYEQALSNMYSESRVKVEKRARYVHAHDYWGVDGR